MIDSSEPQSILELADVGDAVFIDNLMMCSADRLISGRYNPLNDKFGQDSSEALALLFHHDVLNLAIFVESIVCHERIFVNAEYTDRWNNSIQKDLLQHLNKIIRPVAWPKDARAIAEHELVRVAQSMENTGGVSALANIVFRRTHHGFRYDSGKISRFQREYFLPFEEGSTYWGSPIYIALGTVFYLLSSQMLGIPYKPSILRARLLSHTMKSTYESRHFNAAQIATALLEGSREKVANDYFEKLLEMNKVEARLPCIFAAVVKQATTPSDIIKIACEIRDSNDARAFRRWAAEFTNTIHNGDLATIGELQRQLEGIVNRINKWLGLTQGDALSVRLGWGPISYADSFALPRLLKKPIYFRRHLWFLHNLYRGLIAMARISDHVNRVFVSALPRDIRTQLDGNQLNWSNLQQLDERTNDE